MNQNPVNYSSIQTAQPPSRQVVAQLEIIEQEITDNANIIAELENRLQGVSQPVPPVAGEAKSAPEEYLVPLADRLRQNFRRLRAQNIELRRILNGTEL